jgi:hypothetical protein
MHAVRHHAEQLSSVTGVVAAAIAIAAAPAVSVPPSAVVATSPPGEVPNPAGYGCIATNSCVSSRLFGRLLGTRAGLVA